METFKVIESFDFKKYEVVKPKTSHINLPPPLSAEETLSASSLKRQWNEVETYNNQTGLNRIVMERYRKEVADMAQKFRRDAMNLIFPNLNEAEQDLIYNFICETLGIENSLDERLNIFHALLNYHQVTLNIFTKSISNDPRW